MCNNNSTSRKRTIPIELINGKTTTTTTIYDIRYTALLAETCNSVTKPFGYILGLNNNYNSLEF
jgi:hypothetical protein